VDCIGHVFILVSVMSRRMGRHRAVAASSSATGKSPFTYFRETTPSEDESAWDIVRLHLYHSFEDIRAMRHDESVLT